VTLLEMAALLSDDAGKVSTFVDAAHEIGDLAGLLGSLSTSGPSVLFNLGAFNLGAVDVRKVTNWLRRFRMSPPDQGRCPIQHSGREIDQAIPVRPGRWLLLPHSPEPEQAFGLFFGNRSIL